MKICALFLLCLMVGWSQAFSQTPTVNATSCSNIDCVPGYECRIVYESGVITAECLEPHKLPRRNRCGSSGFPILERKEGHRRYTVLLLKEENATTSNSTSPCPPGFLFRRKRCCYDTEKPGACPETSRSVYDVNVTECSPRCQGDNYCRGLRKCCGTSCDNMECVGPIHVDICSSVVCLGDTYCKLTESGPVCQPFSVHRTCLPLDCSPGICPGISQCESDADCSRENKCCMKCSGCHECSPAILHFELASDLCRNISCPPGKQCVQEAECLLEPCPLPEAKCVDKDKPGKCPAITGPGICAFTCENDASCDGAMKCCRTGCGGTMCKPPETCADIRCNQNLTKCLETRKGPRCILQKPGMCPVEVCNGSFDMSLRPCKHECLVDSSCPNNIKCCQDCNGCPVCREPFGLPDFCDDVTCASGEVCRLQRVNCGPCQPVATCVSTGAHLGQCPNVSTIAICSIECDEDSNCTLGLKCCSSACGGAACVPAVPVDSCDIVKCPGSMNCEEVYDSVAKRKHPECIAQETEAFYASDVCSDFIPLLATSFGRRYDLSCTRTPFSFNLCPPGYRCHVTSNHGNICCRISTKGECPALSCIPERTCTRIPECTADPDCEINLKCCQDCDGCSRCVLPNNPQLEMLLNMANLDCEDSTDCSEGHECVVTSAGSTCQPITKPGQCSALRCAERECTSQHECAVDNDCHEHLKCCNTCTGCRKCMCGTEVCEAREECRLRSESNLTCESRAIRESRCPTPRPGTTNVSTCGRFLCTAANSTNCTDRGLKCCSTQCGGTECAESHPPSTCDTANCPSGLACREVYNLTSVTPQCFAHPPTSQQNRICRVGHPLLLQTNTSSGGEVHQASCGSERDAISCPSGYSCKNGSSGAFSVCCRDKEQPCDPPCGPSERCSTQRIVCIRLPCPPSPRCVRVDVCLLPKIVGPCEASIPSYFFNNKTKTCESFNYGGCDGNGNRFDSEESCLKACARHICILPKKEGTCIESILRYYYCPTCRAPKCRPFTYSGCGGNSNQFLNETMCYDVCPPRVKVL